MIQLGVSVRGWFLDVPLSRGKKEIMGKKVPMERKKGKNPEPEVQVSWRNEHTNRWLEKKEG